MMNDEQVHKKLESFPVRNGSERSTEFECGVHCVLCIVCGECVSWVILRMDWGGCRGVQIWGE